MAAQHKRPGKTAKRNRRLGALERLELERDKIDYVPLEFLPKEDKQRIERIRQEIKALESRI